MLSRTLGRRYTGSPYSSGGGAASTWFGVKNNTDSWAGSFKVLLMGLCGIGVINIFTRGNPMGYCEDESQVFIPIRSQLPRRAARPPDSYGFAGDEEDSAASAADKIKNITQRPTIR